MNDLVSVIIPTYKRPENLLRAINSVIGQTYTPIEIIVVDDNGIGTLWQRQTEDLLKTLIDLKQITYIKHDINRNGSAARNTGFRYSSGKYVCFLDDDDVFFPDKITIQVGVLKSTNEEIGATYCNSIIKRKQTVTGVIKEINTNCNKDGNLCLDYLTNKCKFNTSAILFKRECIETLNGFDESFIRHQDYELMTRFFMRYKIVCTSKFPLIIYDVTQLRTFVTTAEKDYAIKLKFLSTFEDDFDLLGIKGAVSHYFWLQCMRTSILSHDWIYLKKAYSKMRKCGSLTLKDICGLIKCALLSLFRRR